MSTTAPAGQIVDGWKAIERIQGTRSWLLRCETCATELTISSIALGKALVFGKGTETDRLPACTGCSDTARNHAAASPFGGTLIFFDLDAVEWPGDDNPADSNEPKAVMLDQIDGTDESDVMGVAVTKVTIDQHDVGPADVLLALTRSMEHELVEADARGVVVEVQPIEDLYYTDLGTSYEPPVETDAQRVVDINEPQGAVIDPVDQPDIRALMLAPFVREMSNQARNNQVDPGPSAVGGCPRKLAHQILYPDEFVGEASGWASMRGTVLHAWASSIVGEEISQRGWRVNLELPKIVRSVTGGTLDLYAEKRIVDYKFPGDWSWKRIQKGYRSPAYLAQLQVYGLGAKLLGLDVEAVVLLVMPPNDKFDDAIYDEYPFDEQAAWEHLDRAELHRINGRTDRDTYLAGTDVADDYCRGCLALKAGRCKGFTIETKGAPAAGSLGLTLDRGVA